jgi:hypothetical protein
MKPHTLRTEDKPLRHVFPVVHTPYDFYENP